MCGSLGQGGGWTGHWQCWTVVRRAWAAKGNAALLAVVSLVSLVKGGTGLMVVRSISVDWLSTLFPLVTFLAKYRHFHNWRPPLPEFICQHHRRPYQNFSEELLWQEKVGHAVSALGMLSLSVRKSILSVKFNILQLKTPHQNKYPNCYHTVNIKYVKIRF